VPTAYGSESLQVLAQVWLSLSKPRCALCRPVDPSSSEIWAAGVVGEKNATLVRDVLALLTAEEQDDIMALCGRCLYHTLQTCVRVHGTGESTFVGEYAARACYVSVPLAAPPEFGISSSPRARCRRSDWRYRRHVASGQFRADGDLPAADRAAPSPAAHH